MLYFGHKEKYTWKYLISWIEKRQVLYKFGYHSTISRFSISLNPILFPYSKGCPSLMLPEYLNL